MQNRPVTILVDPTLLLTLRGKQWITRVYENEQGNALVTSAALWKCLEHEEFDVLHSYRLPWFGLSYGSINIGWLPHLALVRAEESDVTASLMQMGPSGAIAADLWTGLSRGGCLVARRPASFDLFVQAGIRLIVEGPQRYWRQLERVEVDLDSSLAEALARRTRFIAVLASSRGRPTIVVSDVGRKGYR